MPDVTEKPIDSHGSESEKIETVETVAVKPSIPPYVGIALLAAAILVVFLVLNAKSRKSSAADDKSVQSLTAEADALRADLNRQRMSMGLRPLESGSEPIDDIAKRLTKDATTIVGLANSFQNMLREKDAALDAKNAELIRSEQLRQSLTGETARLQTELSRQMVSGADGDLAKRELADVKGQRDRLAAELAKAGKAISDSSGNHSDDEFSLLQRRYEETQRARDFFEKRVKELEAELGRLRIFAKSETELLPEAVELFRTLRGLEGKKDSDNMTAYSEIGVNLGAKVLRTLTFPTGSSQLSVDDQSAIQALVNAVPEGDLVLVVGYASNTGNIDANRVLSSDRATATAQFFATNKRAGQSVQAVYIGETNRFSSAAPERNQICEIWQIRKK